MSEDHDKPLHVWQASVSLEVALITLMYTLLLEITLTSVLLHETCDLNTK